MNITHWVPGADSPRWPCVTSWINLKLPEGATRTFVRSGANNIKYSWNKVVEDFLKTDSEWLFSTHNDVTLDPDTLLRLLSWKKPLISALIFMRNSPVTPHIWQTYDQNPDYIERIKETYEWFYQHQEYASKWGAFVMEPAPNDSLTDLAFTSTSCTLIHRSVLEAMREACNSQWFLWDDDYNGGGEDRRFFQIARSVGFPAYTDRSCIVGHLAGDISIGVPDFIAWTNTSSYQWNSEKK